MTLMDKLLLGLCLLPLVAGRPPDNLQQLVTYLYVNETYVQDALPLIQTLYDCNREQIFCQRGQILRPGNVFQTNYVQLTMEAGGAMNYKQYRASTSRQVHQAHLNQCEIHDGKLLANGQHVRYIRMPAHEHSCYGLYTSGAFNLTLLQVRCDEERVAQFVLGLAMHAVAPLLGERQCSCHVMAIAAGLLLARLGVVCAVLLRDEGNLGKLRPLQANFIQVQRQYPTAVALALVFGAWIMHSCCRCCGPALWRHRCVRRAHRRLIRLVAYYLIYSASDSAEFGAACVALLLPWPEMCWLWHWAKSKCSKPPEGQPPPQSSCFNVPDQRERGAGGTKRCYRLQSVELHRQQAPFTGEPRAMPLVQNQLQNLGLPAPSVRTLHQNQNFGRTHSSRNFAAQPSLILSDVGPQN